MYSSKHITFENIFNLLRSRFLLLTSKCESEKGERVSPGAVVPEKNILANCAHLLSSEKNSIMKKKIIINLSVVFLCVIYHYRALLSNGNTSPEYNV
ncbi:hypothetical protein XELAEV_18022945mg [Xenopus laevis]|uniref:Uncharacterized protein n=1 Tax=Xenopus laevis TaxID=8355 RepID=A0A974D378_XENLA|nr:hypothetical protein XELAEV_18022945mg [Xenopus laevis]